MNAYLLVGIGLLALIVGAEALVAGGSELAARMGVSPMIVGMTVVSIGTSLPELAVGIDAARSGSGPLAVGNIVGTNMVNLLLILGLSAAIIPLALRRRTIKIDLPTIVACAVLLWVLAADGELTARDGLVLLAVAIAYTAVVLRVELRGRGGTETPEVEVEPVDHRRGSVAWDAGRLIVGIAIILVGAVWLVDGAVRVATDLGVSEAVIGLTVIAIGTSAPELVTTMVATVRGDRDLAIGNLFGSSIYNVALILGITALVAPIGVTDELINVDIPLMIAVTLVLVPVFITGRRISRGEGIGFVAAYLVYLGAIILFQA